MLSALFPHLRERRTRENAVRAFVDSLNRRQYRRTAEYVSEDVVFSDVSGDAIKGLDRMIDAVERFRKSSDWPEIVIESADYSDGDVLLRGRLDTSVREIAGDTFWRVGFDDDMISAIEVTRANGNMTVPRYAARYA